jgi:hypothetical protein
LAPASLLPILAGLIQDERLPIRSQFLYRLLQNIAKNPRLRDAVLRLLVSLLVERKDSANGVVSELTGGEMTEFFSSNDSKGDDADGDSTNANRKRAFALPKASLKGGKGLSQLSASRLVAVLFHLASANVSVVYDMLCARVTRGGEVVKSIRYNSDGLPDADREGKSETGKGYKESDEEEKGDEEKGETKDDETHFENSAIGHVEMEEEHEGRSTESLLEMMMPLFAHSNFTSSSSDLSELTAFINVVSAPLEFLGEGSAAHMVRTVCVCLFVCLSVCLFVSYSVEIIVLYVVCRSVIFSVFFFISVTIASTILSSLPSPSHPHPIPLFPPCRLNLN